MSKPITVVCVSRRFDALPEKVFDAWLDPKSTGRWLFATPTGKMVKVEIDARVGGKFTIIEQRGDIKAEHHGQYLEIDRPRRLVFTFGGPGFPDTLVTIDIKPLKKGCELTLKHEDVWLEYEERTQKGWTGILEGLTKNLGEILKNENTSDREIVLSRVINAPRERVWEAWTDPNQVAQWWGPKGFTNPVCKLDVRCGGGIRIDMRGPDGTIYPMTGSFREIVEPERLAFISAALDKNGKPLFEVLTTMTFDTQGKKTKLTLHASVVNRTPEAAPYLTGMNEGWNQSLDRLTDFVADQ